jgi:NAD(P)-dependent dehydrogenase (short-subunit alcohol dehydrogenase family)
MPELTGRTALVTGGARGLGRCHALALARAGAAVLIADIAPMAEEARALVAQISAEGGRADYHEGGIDDWAGAGAAVDAALNAWGGLDIVVNNAGIVRSRLLVDADPELFMAELRVHVLGTLGVSHHAARHWRERGPAEGRAIINTGSGAGLFPLHGAGGYAAAKAAIVALTGVHAAELASLGVRVNAIAPLGRTPMVASSARMAALMPQPDDGFDRHAPENTSMLVVYLASARNRFTGRVFGVGGADVAVYAPFNVIDCISNGERPWTFEQLVAALHHVKTAVRVDTFEPVGRRERLFPDPAVTAKLAEALQASAAETAG